MAVTLLQKRSPKRWLEHFDSCKLLYITPRKFEGQHDGRSRLHRRQFLSGVVKVVSGAFLCCFTKAKSVKNDHLM